VSSEELELLTAHSALLMPGTLLTVRLETEGRSQTVLASVREAVDQGDGSWLLGCDLAQPLSDEELRVLV